jgi:hypothetical protein
MGETVLDKGTISFQAEGRLLQELGERLVASPEVALVELIKNSYDADSPSCEVRLEEAGKVLIIQDKGHGMTFDEFTNQWMRIATPSKIEERLSKIYKRKLTGAKGIGRFAVRFLGDYLTLVTIAMDKDRGYKTRLVAHFDWPEIDRLSNISEAKINYLVDRPAENSQIGTTLKINKLKSTTDFTSNSILKTNVLRIITPLQGLDAGKFKQRDTGLVNDPGFIVLLPDNKEEGQIILQFSGDENDLARQAIIDAEGFLFIMTHLHAAIMKKTNNSLSMILATILGKPEYYQKIELYGVGDQNRLFEILKKEYPKNQREKMMAHFLGYWLWDSLLRYPGIFVNEVASASYLNIDTTDFQKPEIKNIFKTALYKGPFADPNKPYWWRGILDDIVSHDGYTDGLDLVNKKIGFTVERSHCSIDTTKQAGYYCIISGKPVSFENSKGGLSWFPRGADLTRISNPRYEEYSPWIGS